ncbi:hypothetical protein ScPMuIL_004933 [Solemya velum]
MANNRHLLVRLCKLLDEHGFVHQHLVQKNGSSSALYSYGPAGVLLRKHILKTWWDNMVTTQENTFPVQSPTITCQVKRNAYQVQNKPVCDPEPPEMKPTNLGEFRTNLSTDCDDHFNGIARLMNHRLPFSIVQTGLCYNQAPHHPESFLFDSVETTGVVLQHYCPPSTATQAFDRLLNHRLHWWRKLSGKPAEYKVETCKKDTDSGHRAEIQFMFPWGPETIETVVNRGQCLVKEREQSDNSYQFRHGRKTVVPHMVECSSILEQAMMTFCADAYAEKQVFKVKAKTNDNKKLRTAQRNLFQNAWSLQNQFQNVTIRNFDTPLETGCTILGSNRPAIHVPIMHNHTYEHLDWEQDHTE